MTRATSHGWTRAFTFGIGLITIVAITWLKLDFPKGFEWAELKASDIRLYGGSLPEPTGNVVVAAVDDKSIAEFGRFPWPRSIEARLLDALRTYGAAVVGFDIAFSERDPADVEQEQ